MVRVVRVRTFTPTPTRLYDLDPRIQVEMPSPDLPDGWVRWHDGPDGVLIATYRPDVFDGTRFPAACLPTLSVKPKRDRGRRGRPTRAGREAEWTTELILEPDVVVDRTDHRDRDGAVAEAYRLAQAFVNGHLEYRAAYDVPRDRYLAQLDGLLE